MKQIDTIYINGKFETPHGRERLTLIDPVTEQDAAQVLLLTKSMRSARFLRHPPPM